MHMKNFARYAIAAVALTAALPAAEANAAVLVVNVAGAQGFGALGTAANTVRTYNVGAGSTITGISYNVNITARGGSYLSEAALLFSGSNANGDGVAFTPGFEDANPGTATYTGSADLVDLGLSFVVGADGLLRLEYYETFTDGLLPDSIWNSGTLTFTYTPTATGAVPEPATWAMMLMGFGMAGYGLRRRARSVRVTYA